MSPRPRQASDEHILMAAFRAIARLGPARMTLADVAKDAGVSPAALVQRFGSKRALLLAAAADAAGGGEYIFPGLRARHRRPIDALLGLADCMTVMGTTPEAIANNLTFLQIDLKDASSTRTRSPPHEGMRDGIKALIRDAIAAGELVRCDAGRLAAAAARDDERVAPQLGGASRRFAGHVRAEGSDDGAGSRIARAARRKPQVPSPKPHAGSVPLRKRGQTPRAALSPEHFVAVRLNVSPWLAPRH